MSHLCCVVLHHCVLSHCLTLNVVIITLVVLLTRFQIMFCLVSYHHVDPHHVTIKKTLLWFCWKLNARSSDQVRSEPVLGQCCVDSNVHEICIYVSLMWKKELSLSWRSQTESSFPLSGPLNWIRKLNHLLSTMIWRKGFHHRDLISLLFLFHSFRKDSIHLGGWIIHTFWVLTPLLPPPERLVGCKISNCLIGAERPSPLFTRTVWLSLKAAYIFRGGG